MYLDIDAMEDPVRSRGEWETILDFWDHMATCSSPNAIGKSPQTILLRYAIVISNVATGTWDTLNPTPDQLGLANFEVSRFEPSQILSAHTTGQTID